MAKFIDPHTGEPVEFAALTDTDRPTASASWLGMITLLMGLALAGWFYVFSN
ncbi:MAG: hypothetical protein ABW006_12140 [Hyphomicrobium sp.]